MTHRGSTSTARDRILRPVGVLLSGSGAAFLIGYLARPIIMRLFPVEAFGVFEFVVALVAVAIPVASLRYEDAVVLPASRDEARDVWMLSLALTVSTVVLAALGVGFLGHLVPDENTRLWLWTAPLLLLVLRLSKLFELWQTREKAFGTLSAGVVAQRSVTTATQVGAGVAAVGGAGGLLAGFGLGHLTAMLVYARHALTTLTLRGPVKLREPAKRYRRFAQFSSPAALVSALATRLPSLVLLGVFGAEFLGWFGQAFHILYIPLSLVGTAVGQVFFVEAVEARRSGSLHHETASIHTLLASCTVVPLAGICAAAPDVFGFVFGADWRPAGEYAVYLAPWIALSAIGSPLTRVFDVLEQQRRDLAVNIVMFSVVGGALVYISLFSDPLQGVLILGVAGAVSRVIQIAMALRSAGLSPGESFRPYLRPAVEGALLFALMTFARTTFSPGVTTLILALALIAWLPLLYRRTAAS